MHAKHVLWVPLAAGVLIEWVGKILCCLALPLPWAARAIEWSLAARFLPFSLRRQVLENLSCVFGGSYTRAELDLLRREYLHVLLGGPIDFFLGLRITPPAIAELVVVEGREHMDQALSRGKGVIAVTGHYSFMLRGLFVAGALGYTVNAVVRAPREVSWPGAGMVLERVFETLSRKTTVRWLFPGGAFAQAVERLAHNEIVCFAMDVPRVEEKSGGMRVRFLGGEAVFPASLLRLAAETGAPIVPTFVFPRAGSPGYVLRAWPPLIPERRDPEGVRRSLQTCADLLGSLILRYPAHWWLWRDLHIFWRPSSPGTGAAHAGP